MTPEREKEIRDRLYAFKHWKAVSESTVSYEESHGPDMDILLAEIDRLRAENDKVTITSRVIKLTRDQAEKERDQLREKLADSELVRESSYKELLALEKENSLLSIALDRFKCLIESNDESYDDSVIIRCEVTAGDLRALEEAISKIRGEG